MGASNELPESEELDALYDRFLVRRRVAQVSAAGLPALLSLATEPLAGPLLTAASNGVEPNRIALPAGVALSGKEMLVIRCAHACLERFLPRVTHSRNCNAFVSSGYVLPHGVLRVYLVCYYTIDIWRVLIALAN